MDMRYRKHEQREHEILRAWGLPHFETKIHLSTRFEENQIQRNAWNHTMVVANTGLISLRLKMNPVNE